MKILSLDFDGVCHSYISEWQGIDQIPDDPVRGLYEFLAAASKHFEIQIYSTRSETAEGRRAMQNWFYLHRPDDSYLRVLDGLVFPKSKPKALVGLDDRILTFEGQWPEIATLINWKPWNKR